MSEASEKAVQCFNDGFSCSQAVLSSCCERFGVDKELAYKMAGAFGGGMGHVDGACGAVTGALMLIGLKYGKYKKEDTESKDRTYAAVKRYVDAFKARHGSIDCTDLLKFNISLHDELLKAREAGVFKSVCPGLVKESVELVETELG